MTSKKRKYGDLSARSLPTEDPTLIDDVFAAFTGTRPSIAPAESPSQEESSTQGAPPTPARRAAPAGCAGAARRAGAAQNVVEPLHGAEAARRATPARGAAPARYAAPAHGAANKEKALKENSKKGSSRLTPDEIQNFTATVADLLVGGKPMEEVEAQYAPSMHPADWAAVKSVAQ